MLSAQGKLLAVVAGVLGAVGLYALVMRLGRYNLESQAEEALATVAALAKAEQQFHAKNGAFFPLGKMPATVPRARKAEASWPDELRGTASALPTVVRYQYELVVSGPETMIVIARGDLNADMVESEFRLEVRAGKPLGQIERTRPLE
ncbi:MAG: hypothetical protein QM765_50070 [Myxococcales bacterium]